MSESKTYQQTESASEIAPERVDQAHRGWGNHPHVQFGPPRPSDSGTTGRSGPAWGQRSTDSIKSSDERGLPTKLQLKMDRLLADLAALEEPEADVLPLPSRSDSPPAFPALSQAEALIPAESPAQAEAREADDLDDAATELAGAGLEEASLVEVDLAGLDEVDQNPADNDRGAEPGGSASWVAPETSGTCETSEALGELGDVESEAAWVNETQAGPADPTLSAGEGSAESLADSALLADASGAFSRQAREILDILKRRQEQLSYQKNELELREAALEKQLRQERLALVERQRQLQELESQASVTGSSPEPAPWPASFVLDNSPAAESTATVGVESTRVGSEPSAGVATAASEAVSAARRVTPEWIAARERQLHAAGWETEGSSEGDGRSGVKSSVSAAAADLIEGCEEHQDADFYAVIEEYVHRQVQQEAGHTTRMVAESRAESRADAPAGSVTAKSPASSPAAGLQRQAQQLRQQHATAIQAMQQTRRQLELLKDILVQQQQHWAEEVDRLASEQQEWQEARGWQQKQWTVGLEEIERLRTIEQNESAKRATFLDQREAAIQAMEERLQQVQVEILRDRVVLKQLERTVRQALSNADWNQRWQIISEETQGYLKKVHQDAETLQAAAKRKLERLESRQSEMLLYRESLRSWIERQMKLVSRRVAHGEDRQQSLQAQWEAVQVARQELRAQQALLNAGLSNGLQAVDQRLQSTPPYRSDQEAA